MNRSFTSLLALFLLAASADGGGATEMDTSLEQEGRSARARNVDPADGMPGARHR